MTFWTCSACTFSLTFLGEVANRWGVNQRSEYGRQVLAEYACPNPACPRHGKVVTVEETG